jgi:hypothetical protein
MSESKTRSFGCSSQEESPTGNMQEHLADSLALREVVVTAMIIEMCATVSASPIFENSRPAAPSSAVKRIAFASCHPSQTHDSNA